jgi:hypothetical protein
VSLPAGCATLRNGNRGERLRSSERRRASCGTTAGRIGRTQTPPHASKTPFVAERSRHGMRLRAQISIGWQLSCSLAVCPNQTTLLTLVPEPDSRQGPY